MRFINKKKRMDKVIGYDTSIVLTYYECKKPPNLTGKYDELDFMNDEDYSDLVFRDEFLNVFKMDSYDDDVINSTTELVYNVCNQKYPEFIEICMKNAAQNMSEDPLLGFMMFFSYDYFHIVHKFICSSCKDEECNLEESFNLIIQLNK
jgi:hypothetical protein